MAQVYVVDRAALFGGSWPQGFQPIASAAAPAFLDRAFRLGRFVDRPLAEQTPTWKQWIPYCVLRCWPGTDAAGGKGNPGCHPGRLEPQSSGILCVQRTKGQNEARLHGSWSIGIGGHVEPEDHAAPAAGLDGGRFFVTALCRELHEELDLGTSPLPRPQLLGLLNDDRTEVGRVHAGLAYALDLPMTLGQARAAVGIREISKMHGSFGSLVEFAELWQDPMKFESWSQFLIHAGVAGHMGASPNPQERCHDGRPEFGLPT